MKKYLFVLLFLILPSLMMAQGVGGQIKRPTPKTQVNKKTQPNKKPVKRSVADATGYDVTFTSNVPSATLYIDGNINGTASGSRFLKTGQHIVKLVANGYSDLTKTILVSSKSKSFTLNMTKASTTINNTFTSSSNTTGAISQFFPIWGMILGQTTWSQAEALGYKVKTFENGPKRNTDVNGVTFWDHDVDGYFTSLYWVYFDADFPPEWKSKGFSWENSYDKWISVFKNLGFSVSVKKAPTKEKYSDRNTLSAKFEAISSDGTLEFDMQFDYGDKGYQTSSPNTLYSITINSIGSPVSNNQSYTSNSSPVLGSSSVSLKDLLARPMGTVDCDVIHDSYSTIKRKMSSKYNVDDSATDKDNYWFYIRDSENSSTENLVYYGIPFHYCTVAISKSNNHRELKYIFEIRKSQISSIETVMDAIVQDFHKIGINIPYQRKDEQYNKGGGKIKMGNVEYELRLSDYSTWYVEITQWINY